MAKKTASNLAELNEYLKTQLSSVMKQELAQVVKETESDMVEKEVYNRYKPSPKGKPWTYQRRGTDKGSGGLGDIENMKAETAPTLTGVELTVTNTTTGQQDTDMQIADLVEGGDNTNGKEYKHKGDGSGEYLEARPFQKETLRELQESGKAVDVLKKGLRARGLSAF
ncbi:hypothetical protein CIL05_06770 [Virgibacillus profundi]|uniref:HK97 gp10 family phage protein n=1 Tax=Virgibacillus profundi TaxID=2024555 RepID=A0A2A2IFZ8_9BACI|nr:hypothetical protein [Virgibacillus profundi]PAV30164.1 hypothetical protein CIL05_06770 [Virgibacillus profundi]PXY54336.1 hypothetical protein CIT14_06855 [Virgibacillus profundi]